MSAQDKIQKTINEHNVVLYMKGSPKFPQCGFSSLATQILDACDTDFHAVDVLQDPKSEKASKCLLIGQLFHSFIFMGNLLAVLTLSKRCMKLENY